jgi:hypothetical protein
MNRTTTSFDGVRIAYTISGTVDRPWHRRIRPLTSFARSGGATLNPASRRALWTPLQPCCAAKHPRSVTRYSILDLCSVKEGGDAAESFRTTLDLARRAEMWGYTRFWLAEHHNMEGIASSATSVLIGYVVVHAPTMGSS